MTDTVSMTPADLDSALDKLAAFAATLEPAERIALNTVAALAQFGADVAGRATFEPAGDEAEVEGFMIISGSRSGPGSGGSGGGGGSGNSLLIPAPAPPAGPGGIPIPYPNVSSTLRGKFPF